jgi:hypothetical protein
MSSALDETDVPPVPPAALARAMRFMIDNGRGLVLLRGLAAGDMRELEAAVWHRLEGSIAERRAVLVRFRCLVEVFAARRLQALMLRRGFRLIAPAIQLAADSRLNAKWGFSPHKFNLGLQALAHQLEQPSASTAPAGEPLDLAA